MPGCQHSGEDDIQVRRLWSTAHARQAASDSAARFPKRTAHQAVNRVAQAIVESKTRIIDIDLRAYLDTASYCPLVHEMTPNRSDC